MIDGLTSIKMFESIQVRLSVECQSRCVCFESIRVEHHCIRSYNRLRNGSGGVEA